MLVKTKGQKDIQVKSANDIYDVLIKILKRRCRTDRKKEHFIVVGLTTRNNIEYIEIAAIGTLKSTVVGPSEVFRYAISKAVAQLVVAHNHPSGNLKPSDADKRITQKLVEAGKIIDIQVLDHIIISNEGYFSFAEEGLL